VDAGPLNGQNWREARRQMRENRHRGIDVASLLLAARERLRGAFLS
jgi:hypothetical protein